ncbi:MAG TPA: acyl-CoA thioesterase [Chloroflexi bacterium]|nr:acyl-CoA thioesterase [Chloroflexota bacterium]
MTNDQSEETSFHVRFAETDLMGIVHHSAYLVWFEEARSAFMRAKGTSYTAFEAEGVSLAVSEAEVRYIAPAKYDRLITAQCQVDEVKSRKITFSYTVFDAETGQKLATGVTRHICITRDGRMTRVPDEWRKMFISFQGTS